MRLTQDDAARRKACEASFGRWLARKQENHAKVLAKMPKIDPKEVERQARLNAEMKERRYTNLLAPKVEEDRRRRERAREQHEREQAVGAPALGACGTRAGGVACPQRGCDVVGGAGAGAGVCAFGWVAAWEFQPSLCCDLLPAAAAAAAAAATNRRCKNAGSRRTKCTPNGSTAKRRPVRGGWTSSPSSGARRARPRASTPTA